MTPLDWFARPWLLGLALLPVAARLALTLRQAPAREPFADPASLASLTANARRRPRVSPTLVALAWLLIAVGAAGPRWGVGEPDGVARGRDVVVLIDLSGSMLAADTDGPARWQTAVRAASTLGDWLRSAPGNRVAVVAFAANPKVVVPLTADANHLETALAELDGDAPPPATRGVSGDPSGTRFGRAIAAASALCEPGRAGQDVILLSDGDDPAGDREWATGVTAARAVGVPVHTVGIGSADASPIFRRGELIKSDIGGVRAPVMTRLNEPLLRELAAEARGDAIVAGQATPDLAAFARELSRRGADRELIDNPASTRRDRAPWFLLAGVACWLAGRWR